MIQINVMIIDQRDEPHLKACIPRNKLTPKVENNKIPAYSAKKINTKPTDEYSILNPETSSDSPSEKSNGVRLVSAIIMTNHNTKTIGAITINNFDLLSTDPKLILKTINANDIRIRAKLISYEMVCATPRRDPRIAYFLFDAHPIKSNGYTPTLRIIMKIIMLNLNTE